MTMESVENGDFGGAGSVGIVMDVLWIQGLEHVAAGQGVDGQDEEAYGKAKHRSQSWQVCVVRVCSLWPDVCGTTCDGCWSTPSSLIYSAVFGGAQPLLQK